VPKAPGTNPSAVKINNNNNNIIIIIIIIIRRRRRRTRREESVRAIYWGVSRFCRDVYKIRALLTRYASAGGSFVPTFRHNLSVTCSRLKKSKKEVREGRRNYWTS
jgi:hypothetical protein